MLLCSSSSSSLLPLLLALLLTIAIAGKSAQLGLHGWLPDAMEGPTRLTSLECSLLLLFNGLTARASYRLTAIMPTATPPYSMALCSCLAALLLAFLS